MAKTNIVDFAMDILHGSVLKDSSDLAAEVASEDMSALKALSDNWDANGRVQIEQKIATLSVKNNSRRSSNNASSNAQVGTSWVFWATLVCCYRRQFKVPLH